MTWSSIDVREAPLLEEAVVKAVQRAKELAFS
jgi:hypothetical protein